MRIKVRRGLDRSVPQLLLRDLGGYADVVQDRSMYVTQLMPRHAIKPCCLCRRPQHAFQKKARTGTVFECRSEKTTRWCELLSIVLLEFNLPRRACRKEVLPTAHRAPCLETGGRTSTTLTKETTDESQDKRQGRKASEQSQHGGSLVRWLGGKTCRGRVPRVEKRWKHEVHSRKLFHACLRTAASFSPRSIELNRTFRRNLV